MACLQAMVYVHSKGVIHGDLKSSNINVSSKDRYVVHTHTPGRCFRTSSLQYLQYIDFNKGATACCGNHCLCCVLLAHIISHQQVQVSSNVSIPAHSFRSAKGSAAVSLHHSYGHWLCLPV